MKTLITATLLLALTGCAGVQKSSSATAEHRDESTFAVALSEAFESYEREVQVASVLSYASEEEARAVASSLSTGRFDFQLDKALARNGLTRAQLSEYAAAHPEFFHAQQRAYWGRLQSIEHAVEAIAHSAVASPAEIAVLTADLGE
jgi:hypothetical protein